MCISAIMDLDEGRTLVHYMDSVPRWMIKLVYLTNGSQWKTIKLGCRLEREAIVTKKMKSKVFRGFFGPFLSVFIPTWLAC